jgi:ADP-ribosylglycohydrolase
VSDRTDTLTGVLLGTAVGDALGLPREGLSPRRARRLFGGPPLRHRLVFGRGMVSDDTEHACVTAQALLRSPRRTSSGASSRLIDSLVSRPRNRYTATTADRQA